MPLNHRKSSAAEFDMNKENDPLPPSFSGRLGTTWYELQNKQNVRSSGQNSVQAQ